MLVCGVSFYLRTAPLVQLTGSGGCGVQRGSEVARGEGHKGRCVSKAGEEACQPPIGAQPMPCRVETAAWFVSRGCGLGRGCDEKAWVLRARVGRGACVACLEGVPVGDGWEPFGLEVAEVKVNSRLVDSLCFVAG